MNGSDCSAVCGSDANSRATAEFWLERVGVPLVGTAGLLGNIAAIAVLRSVAGAQLFYLFYIFFTSALNLASYKNYLSLYILFGSKCFLWR